MIRGKRLLILEDDQCRHVAFKRKFIGNTIVIVTTATDAIERLDTEKWDCVFLDHDLGGESMVESGAGTGYEVAQWLAANKKKQPPCTIIHSFNPAGRENMARVLRDSQPALCPGIWLEDSEFELSG